MDQFRTVFSMIKRFNFNPMKMTIEKTTEERRTPDFRHQECKHWHYNEHLPMVSIIIIFQDEDFSGGVSI